MSRRNRHTDYDEQTTARCERALVTLLGDLGPWRERIFLAGGLAPRYLVGRLPEEARAHVGTTDVDLVIGLALGDEPPETYRTLQNNIEKSGAHLLRDDFIEREIEGERLDGGGQSKVSVRVANLLPYTVLKILAFQDRHENKDAYDLVFTLLHAKSDPHRARLRREAVATVRDFLAGFTDSPRSRFSMS